jgi:D-alanyl-D-alanine carboxypeptidase
VIRWSALLVAVVVAGCGAETAGSPHEDGYIPEGERVSPFDDANAAVGKLDPDLLAAVRAAAEDAAEDGVEVGITSGWRSADFQRRLLADAVHRYGSLDEARRYVSSPEKSKHVVGRAVDIGPTDAADWMTRHGDDYGLCQAYANEMWHFELLTEPGGECPPMRTDATG